MKLRAQIVIDIEAADYSDAAEHQRRIEGLLDSVRQEYAQTAMTFRERRDRQSRMVTPPPSGEILHYTGRVHGYE